MFFNSADDFNDPVRLQKISTLNTIVAVDLGAVPNNSRSMNYSHEMYRINRWFGTWLPDRSKRQDSKITYNIDIAYANGTNETFVFHGPPGQFLFSWLLPVVCFFLIDPLLPD